MSANNSAPTRIRIAPDGTTVRILPDGGEVAYTIPEPDRARVDALTDGRRLRGIQVANKAGLELVLARVIVDGTGDGDIAARAGALDANVKVLDALLLRGAAGHLGGHLRSERR